MDAIHDETERNAFDGNTSADSSSFAKDLVRLGVVLKGEMVGWRSNGLALALA
jgi:hypothetical protein